MKNIFINEQENKTKTINLFNRICQSLLFRRKLVKTNKRKKKTLFYIIFYYIIIIII